METEFFGHGQFHNWVLLRGLIAKTAPQSPKKSRACAWLRLRRSWLETGQGHASSGVVVCLSAHLLCAGLQRLGRKAPCVFSPAVVGKGHTLTDEDYTPSSRFAQVGKTWTDDGVLPRVHSGSVDSVNKPPTLAEWSIHRGDSLQAPDAERLPSGDAHRSHLRMLTPLAHIRGGLCLARI